ncbi:MAG: ABC transporter ATP-binding protein [Acidimicrobiia bacterium]
MGGESAARVENATKIYGEGDTRVVALDGIAVSFERSRFTAIMGASGSGKSTLLHCLAGLDDLTSGSVFIGHTSLGDLSERELTLIRRERVGFIFQSFNLIPTLDAGENITLPVAIAGGNPDAAWYDTVVTTMGLGDRLKHRPSELSGGQQQRVAAARALVSRPEIVFADEPSGNLDSKSGDELLGLLRRAADEFGQTIVMVTHDPRAAAWADRVVFLADGQVVGELHDPNAEQILEFLKGMG